MELFTVKDFITLSCLNCNKTPSFYLERGLPNENSSLLNLDQINKDMISVIINNDYYSQTKLTIDLITSQFTFFCSKESQYKKNIEDILTLTFSLISFCSICQSSRETRIIELDPEKRIVKPFKIGEELIYVDNEDYRFYINSEFIFGRSDVLFYKKDSNDKLFNNINNKGWHQRYYSSKSPQKLDIPFLKRSDFKNKKELLDKLEMIMFYL